ncbi:MAG: hypothetical protein ACFFCW_36635 [Candidatus Hodarchaeota archaeon]
MESEAHVKAKQLVTLLKSVFKLENVDVEILQDKYQGFDTFRVCGCIDLGIFNFPIDAETFDLSLSLSWTKNSEFGYAHQWIGPRTRRQKPTYRKNQ